MSKILVLLILLFPTIADARLANGSKVLFGSIDIDSAKTMKLALTAGDSSIRLSADNVVSCYFLDSSGNIGRHEEYTMDCSGSLHLNRKDFISLIIENHSNKAVKYRIDIE